MRISDWSSDVCSSDLHLHRWMPQYAVLDFARTDAIACRGDDVVVAANEMDISVFVHAAGVTGDQPIADELFFGGLDVVPVLQEQHRVRAPHGNAACHTGILFFAFVIDNRQLMARHGTAYGPRTRRHDAVAGRDCHIAFSLSVELIDGQEIGRTTCREKEWM